MKFHKNIAPILFNAKANQDFDLYTKLVNEKKHYTDNYEKWREYGKKIKKQLLLANMHYFAQNMYAIPELVDDESILSTVEKVSDHLVSVMTRKMHEEKYAAKSKGKNPDYYVDYEMVSREYFEGGEGGDEGEDIEGGEGGERNEYFGELHVYLDGSGRNTHFVGAPL